MGTTLVHEDYRQGDYDDVQFQVGNYPARLVAGVSPFDVPDFVEVQIQDDGACRLLFSYPGDERVEKREWEWPGVPGVFVRVGQSTRRIRELLIREPDERFATANLQLHDLDPFPWSREAPRATQISASRNRMIIVRILETMPDQLRQQIVQLTRALRLAARR